MKKQLLGLMTILTILNACQKNEASVSLPEDVTIHATIEDKDATKTIMDESNNILWTENDQIIAFMKSSYGHKYQVKPSFIGKSYADFSMVSSGNGSDLSAGNEWEHNVVYYPYSENIECLKSGANYALEVNLPAEQTYVPDSFANGSMAMVAVSENNNITFKNVLGGIKLQLKGTQKITSITIEGKNNEKLSGEAIVTAYTDDNKPAITMTSDALTSVTLNSTLGVQLNESTATQFIITLPPVLFSKGFTITVIDSDNQTYSINSDKANTVLRSSLLTMPSIKLEEEIEQPEEEPIVPVATVMLSSTSSKVYEGATIKLKATVKPNDATYNEVLWSSDCNSVASVNQDGYVTALSEGTAVISATAGGVVGNCTITVLSLPEVLYDYVDEYGINHGKGTIVGSAIWAPVNCGYHSEDFKYGKLYQWGRKYGQGYNGALWDNGDNSQTYTDAILPTIAQGGVSEITGNNKSNENVVYKGTSDNNYDWVYPSNSKLWNSGTESLPMKTNYDPCPEGWRVPTRTELKNLMSNRIVSSQDGIGGFKYYGESCYDAEFPYVFLPKAGGDTNGYGTGGRRELEGYYWTSTPTSTHSYYLVFGYIGTDAEIVSNYFRASRYSVRCVQE